MFDFHKNEFKENSKNIINIEYTKNQNYENSRDDCLLIAESEFNGYIYENIDDLNPEIRSLHEIKIQASNESRKNIIHPINCDYILHKIKNQSKLKVLNNQFFDYLAKAKKNFWKIFDFLPINSNSNLNKRIINNNFAGNSMLQINSSFEILGVMIKNLLGLYYIGLKGIFQVY